MKSHKLTRITEYCEKCPGKALVQSEKVVSKDIKLTNGDVFRYIKKLNFAIAKLLGNKRDRESGVCEKPVDTPDGVAPLCLYDFLQASDGNNEFLH